MCALNREELLPGIFFSRVSDERFKTNVLSVQLIAPLRKETAALHALLPNLLRKGCRAYPDFSELNNRLNELYGASIECGVDKIGDDQLVSLSVAGIDDRFTLEQEPLNQELAELLASILLDPVMENGEFLDKELKLEKTTLIDTINAEINDKRTYALNAANRMMCKDEPYGLSKYGTVEQVRAITKSELSAAYRDLLCTSRIELLFVGCGDGEEVRTVFAGRFTELDRNYVAQEGTKAHEPFKEVLEQEEHMSVSQSKMVLGFSTGITSTDERIPALLLACTILGGTPMSKLFLNVREKLSLCYYCVSRMDGRKGIVKIDCGVEKENIQKAREEILNQMEDLKQGNFNDEDIRNAVMSLQNSYRTTNDSNSSVLVYYLGQIMNGTIRTPEENAERYERVTKEQILEAANLLSLDVVYILTGKEE